jgi:flagellar hook-associated protein 2
MITYNGTGIGTVPGSYDVNITQLATRGVAVGSTAANTTINSGSNDALSFVLNGVTSSVTLAAGSYTAQALATELQTKINTALTANGLTVGVVENAGVLTLTSNTYGSTSTFSVTGGNGATGLFGTPTITNGVNVAGTIGGIAGTGSGQTLAASSGNSQGISILVAGGATGARGTVNYSKGYATQLNTWATTMLSTSGPITSSTDGLAATIKDISKRRTELQSRLVDIEKRYRAQYSRLDGMLASMNTTSSYLTTQLAKL